MIIILVILLQSQTAIWRHFETEVTIGLGQVIHGGLRTLERAFYLNNLIIANESIWNRDKILVVSVNKLLRCLNFNPQYCFQLSPRLALVILPVFCGFVIWRAAVCNLLDILGSNIYLSHLTYLDSMSNSRSIFLELLLLLQIYSKVFFSSICAVH